jgi:hypothetical protein
MLVANSLEKQQPAPDLRISLFNMLYLVDWIINMSEFLLLHGLCTEKVPARLLARSLTGRTLGYQFVPCVLRHTIDHSLTHEQTLPFAPCREDLFEFRERRCSSVPLLPSDLPSLSFQVSTFILRCASSNQ